jgi:hypothetical protein
LKVAQNKTFVFSSIKSFTNPAPSNNSQNKYTMMLSYATNFRSEKKSFANTMYSSQEQTKKESAPTTMNRASVQEQFNADINKFEEAANSEINYKYNPTFNYEPELQNQDDHSTFYRKPDTATSGTKSSLKSPMSRTAQSFKEVKFNLNRDDQSKGMKRAETSQNVRKSQGSQMRIE